MRANVRAVERIPKPLPCDAVHCSTLETKDVPAKLSISPVERNLRWSHDLFHLVEAEGTGRRKRPISDDTMRAGDQVIKITLVVGKQHNLEIPTRT